MFNPLTAYKLEWVAHFLPLPYSYCLNTLVYIREILLFETFTQDCEY